MNRELRQRIASKAGCGLEIGSMFSPRPWFPSRCERAELVARCVPPWAIASGQTAGWVWTGMGLAEPWIVLRPSAPEISPLERTRWKARRLSEGRHRVVGIGSLRLLDCSSAVREILLGEGDIDSGASQLALMTDSPGHALLSRIVGGRTRRDQRQHARDVVNRLDHLRERYPDITRYTS